MTTENEAPTGEFKASQEIHWSDYDGPLYCHHCDKLHENAEEWGDCQMESIPRIIPSKEQALKLAEYYFPVDKILRNSAKRVLKSNEQYHPEDITAAQPDDLIEPLQRESLRAVLEAWKISNKPRYYVPDEGVFVDFAGFLEAREKRLSGDD